MEISQKSTIYNVRSLVHKNSTIGGAPPLHAKDPAHRILFCSDPSGWTMPSGRPHASWLRPVESYLKDMGMTGLASAWAMARLRPKYRRKVP